LWVTVVVTPAQLDLQKSIRSPHQFHPIPTFVHSRRRPFLSLAQATMSKRGASEYITVFVLIHHQLDDD
jgi:hypothetical protein